MYSKVKLMGRTLHPMLVVFPITFYTTTFVTLVVYAFKPDIGLFDLSYMANIAAVVTALVAALPGFIDWLAIPYGSKAKMTGLRHMLLNVTSLVLFFSNIFVSRQELREAVPDPRTGLILTGAGIAAMLGAGFLGWKLTQKHHVGVDLSPEQEKLEPLGTDKA